MRGTFIVGIDPGITGAVAVLHLSQEGQVLLRDVMDMPSAKVTTGRARKAELILPQLRDYLDPYAALGAQAFIEQVGAAPGQGVVSMFRFGHAAGAAEGVCAGLGMPVNKVRPQEWQKLARARKDPDSGRHRVCQLFPSMSTHFARKKDHNRADAALIGYAGASILWGSPPYTG